MKPSKSINSVNAVRAGAIFGLLGVVLGAFGAHALKDGLVERGSLATWETAVDYQMWHALALVLAGLLGRGLWTCLCFVAGICLFSGSLYFLALGGPGWLGPVTPLGGLLLIAGWLGFLLASREALPDRQEEDSPERRKPSKTL